MGIAAVWFTSNRHSSPYSALCGARALSASSLPRLGMGGNGEAGYRLKSSALEFN
jgi:hypothetical protein